MAWRGVALDPVSFWSPGGEYHPDNFSVATPNDVTDAGRSGEVLAAQWGNYRPETFFFVTTPNDVTDAGRSG